MCCTIKLQTLNPLERFTTTFFPQPHPPAQILHGIPLLCTSKRGPLYRHAITNQPTIYAFNISPSCSKPPFNKSQRSQIATLSVWSASHLRERAIPPKILEVTLLLIFGGTWPSDWPPSLHVARAFFNNKAGQLFAKKGSHLRL